MGIFTDFLNTGANLAAIQSGINQARQTGQLGLNTAQQMGQQALSETRFQPFTVSTRTGSVQTGPTGDVTTALSPEQAALQSNLFGQGSGMLTGLGNVDQRSQQLFDLLSGIRRPEIERQRLGLEERLFNQGRSGVRTDLYGGTPEQLALEKAIQEQMSQDVYTARNQALGEQQQQFNIGSGLLSQSYLPEQQLLPFLQAGTTLSDIAGTGNRQGAQLKALLGQTGLESLLAGETVAGNLQQAQIQSLLDVLSSASAGGTGSGLLSSIDEGFQNILDSILGGLGF